MKLFLTALRTCPKFLNWLLLISLLLLVVKVLVLDQIPAQFGNAARLGELVEDILVANIAGYLFYILSAQIPKVIELRQKGKEVIAWAERAANNVTGFLQMLHYSNMSFHPDEPTILDIHSVDETRVELEFSLVSPTALAPMSDGFQAGQPGPTLSWLAAMATHDRWCQETISKIWSRYPFFDADMSKLLSEIESSPHSAGMKQDRVLTLELLKNGGTLSNRDLSSWATNYYDCYESARRLVNYCNKFKRDYSITT